MSMRKRSNTSDDCTWICRNKKVVDGRIGDNISLVVIPWINWSQFINEQVLQYIKTKSGGLERL